MRAYVEFNAIDFVDSVYTFASTSYAGIMMKTSATIPDSVSVNSYKTLHCTRNVTDETITSTFVCPDIFDTLVLINGVVSGSCKFSAYYHPGHLSDYITITQLNIKLSAFKSGSSTTIFDETVWTGTLTAEDPVDENVKTIMYWFNVDDTPIHVDERLKLEYTFTYTTYDYLSDGDFDIRHYLNSDTGDSFVSIPFIMGGGR